jgi:hypothetical protein
MRKLDSTLESAVMGLLVGTLMVEASEARRFLRVTDVNVAMLDGTYANEVTVTGASGSKVRITVEEVADGS